VEPVIELASAFVALADRDEATIRKYGPHYYDDPRAKELARIIETDLGISQVEILGHGSFGVAAATAPEGGDVIKLTTDPTEVESAAVLASVGLGGYPKNVVHVQGGWYIRRLRMYTDLWAEPPKNVFGDLIYHQGQRRIGLIRMERLHPLSRNQPGEGAAMSGLSQWTRYIKQTYKVWPHQTHRLSREATRKRYLEAGQALERMLLDLWEKDHEQIARDVAGAIAQLRALGIYGTDFHGGNVGYQILTTSAPAPGMPQVAQARERANPIHEETMKYGGVAFDLIVNQLSSDRTQYWIRMSPDEQPFGPFGVREEAIQFAYDKIDEKQLGVPAGTIAPAPAPTTKSPAVPLDESRVYKVFDVGMSSVGPEAEKPKELGAGKRKAPPAGQTSLRFVKDREGYDPPMVEHVKVAELG